MESKSLIIYCIYMIYAEAHQEIDPATPLLNLANPMCRFGFPKAILHTISYHGSKDQGKKDGRSSFPFPKLE